MSVDNLNPQYLKFSTQWERTRNTLEGDEAVKAMGTDVVPAFSSFYTNGVLNKKIYEDFLKQATLSEYADKILKNANGLLYAKEPVVTFTDNKMQEIIDDITLDGQSLIDLMKQGTEEIFAFNRVCYLVDVAIDNRSDEEKESTVFYGRPYVTEYKTESVINWKYEKIDGVNTLVMVTLKEDKSTWVDDFTNEIEEIYRVLRLTNGVYTQQVYEKVNSEFVGGEIITPRNAGSSLSYIPFYAINTKTGMLDLSKAPLVPIVNLNLYHFMRSVDKGYQLHQMSAGTIVIGGVDNFVDENGNAREFKVGGSYVFPPVQGGITAQILERSGDGIPSQERDIETTVESMYSLGIGMLEQDKKGVESNESINSRNAGERSVVTSVASTASQQYTKILKTLAEWYGINTDITVELNTDYVDVAMTMAEVKLMNEANLLNPTFTQEEMFNILVKRGIHPEAAEYEDHKTAIEDETPKLTVSPCKTC